MEWIDTHSHIYDEQFDEDREEALARAKEASVVSLILPGIDIESYDRMISCADSLKGYAFPCIGLHPTSVGENWREELDFVRDHLGDRPFVAIGEIGLDAYWSKEFIEQQKRVLAEQLEIASRAGLPVILHVREATDVLFEVLEDVKGLELKGSFHAYSGSYETYKRGLKYGDFKFGIGGVVTYKKAGIAQDLPRMSMSDIILETDCPWLTPVPHRGHRNESSYIPIIGAQVASLTGLSIEEVAATTTRNARQLFNLAG